MTKKTMMGTAVIGLLLINFCLVLFLVRQKPMFSPGQESGSEGPKNMIIEKLDFAPDQIIVYDKMIAKHQTEIRSVNDQINQVKNKLYGSLKGDDQTEKDSLINELGSLQRRIETIHYNHFLALKKLCTGPQRQKFNELTSELARHFAPMRIPPGSID